MPNSYLSATVGRIRQSKSNQTKSMKESLAEFCFRIGTIPRPRNIGQPHECLAILPFPDGERIAAFNLRDYYVSASVSGPCLEFRPRIVSK